MAKQSTPTPTTATTAPRTGDAARLPLLAQRDQLLTLLERAQAAELDALEAAMAPGLDPRESRTRDRAAKVAMARATSLGARLVRLEKQLMTLDRAEARNAEAAARAAERLRRDELKTAREQERLDIEMTLNQARLLDTPGVDRLYSEQLKQIAATPRSAAAPSSAPVTSTAVAAARDVSKAV